MKQEAARRSESWMETFYTEFFSEINRIEEEETVVEESSPVARPLDLQEKRYKKLIKYLIHSARKRHFKEAEKARSLMYQINPGAARDIYRAGRFIEIEKRKVLAKK